MGMKLRDEMHHVLTGATRGVSHAIVTLRELGRDEDADELMLIREALVKWSQRAIRRAGGVMGRQAVPPIAIPMRAPRKPALRTVLGQPEYAELLERMRAEVANG
jgi:hypothetical protein